MEPIARPHLQPARATPFLFTTVAAIACAALAGRLAAQEANLKWLATDVQSKLGSYPPNPQPLRLSETRPAALKKAPEDLKAPLYGELKIGPKDSPIALLVLLDEPDGQPARLFIDANRNGNLTDDPAIRWEEQKTAGPGGRETPMYNGSVTVKIPYPGGTREAHLLLSRYAKNASNPAAFRDLMFYSRDYALTGDVKLGDKTYSAVLVDEAATGDFRPAPGKSANIRFLIDVDGDGRFDPRRESHDVRNPFNIGGTTYEIADMKPDGRFRIAKSSKTAEEMLPAPDLSKGSKAPAFAAKTTEGKELKFPGDFKGKIVLLDFWATWCPPCIREVPNVVANYEKFHDKGFEILGISLDRPDAEEKLTIFVKEHKMAWPQVFELKAGQSRIAQQYGILTIPYVLIVDGDTGEILSGSEARGQNLGPAIESGLAKKAAPKKTEK